MTPEKGHCPCCGARLHQEAVRAVERQLREAEERVRRETIEECAKKLGGMKRTEAHPHYKAAFGEAVEALLSVQTKG